MARQTREEENGCCEEHDDERVEHHHHKYQDICAPGQDGEVIFNKNRCLSTDQRFIWDYRQGLLTIDGRFAASGYISSGSQIEGAYLAPQALGLGSFAFTPPSGYGGIVYRGGSIFYYWNDDVNAWEEVDFGPATQEIDVAHNGVLIGTRSVLNFQDSVSVTWTIDDPGTFINISASDGNYGPWQENQNANGWSIYNLYQLNGVNVSDYLTKLWNQNVDANNYSLTNVGNLSVNGQIYYKGQTLEEYLQSLGGGDLWSLSPDGSIYRQSKVYVYGPDLNPMEIISAGHTNFLYLNVTDAFAEGYCAYAAKTDGQYFGELGFSYNQVELWHNNGMVFTAIGSQIYYPGMIGIGIAPPQIHYPLDIYKTLGYNARFRDKGSFSAIIIDHDIEEGGESCVAFWSGGHERSLIEYDSDEDNLIFWTGGRDADISTLCCSTDSYVGVRTTSPVYPLDVSGDIHTSGCVLIGSKPISLCASSDGSTLLIDGQNIGSSVTPSCALQSPWLCDINADGRRLYNAYTIATHAPGPSAASGFILQDFGYAERGRLSYIPSVYPAGPSTQNTIQLYADNELIFGTNAVAERMRITATGNVGIGKFPTTALDVRGNVNAEGYLRNGTPMMLLTVEEHKGIFDKLNEMDSLMRVMRQRMDI